MKTSIILPCCIVNDELLTLTANTLTSLGETKDIEDTELIIIDNGSPIGGDMLMKVAQKYLRNSRNVGYPKSINQGVSLADGDLIVVANNDIRVSPNWLNETRIILSEDAIEKRIGSIHFRMIDYDNPFKLGDKIYYDGRERWCTSSFYAIRKEAYAGYDERYGLGGYDDYSFWARVRKNGWKSVYTTKACYQHKHSSTQIALDKNGSRDKSDNKNKELFKKDFGFYPDEYFKNMYPEQYAKDYYSFFKKL